MFVGIKTFSLFQLVFVAVPVFRRESPSGAENVHWIQVCVFHHQPNSRCSLPTYLQYFPFSALMSVRSCHQASRSIFKSDDWLRLNLHFSVPPCLIVMVPFQGVVPQEDKVKVLFVLSLRLKLQIVVVPCLMVMVPFQGVSPV